MNCNQSLIKPKQSPEDPDRPVQAVFLCTGLLIPSVPQTRSQTSELSVHLSIWLGMVPPGTQRYHLAHCQAVRPVPLQQPGSASLFGPCLSRSLPE